MSRPRGGDLCVVNSGVQTLMISYAETDLTDAIPARVPLRLFAQLLHRIVLRIAGTDPDGEIFCRQMF